MYVSYASLLHQVYIRKKAQLVPQMIYCTSPESITGLKTYINELTFYAESSDLRNYCLCSTAITNAEFFLISNSFFMLINVI